MNQQFIQSLSIDWNKIEDDSYLREIEAINKLKEVLVPLMEAKDYLSIKNSLDIKLPQLPRGSEEEVKAKKEEMPQLKCTDISSAVFSVLSEVYNNSQVVCFSSNFSSNDPRLI